MRTVRVALFTLLAGTLGIGVVVATLAPRDKPIAQSPSAQGQPQGQPRSQPRIELVFAQPFSLDVPYEHTWRKEQPSVLSGWILVIRTDPALLVPRQTADPVLYVGNETAERLNAGDSGNLVVLVPSPLDTNGVPTLDPAAAPIWFGADELPERVDAARIQAELSAALAQRVGPATSTALRSQGQPGTVFALDRSELELHLADLVEFYSPTESDLVAGMRAPILR